MELSNLVRKYGKVRYRLEKDMRDYYLERIAEERNLSLTDLENLIYDVACDLYNKYSHIFSRFNDFKYCVHRVFHSKEFKEVLKQYLRFKHFEDTGRVDEIK